jgi:GNAT superfamily N-acetyltransferase
MRTDIDSNKTLVLPYRINEKQLELPLRIKTVEKIRDQPLIGDARQIFYLFSLISEVYRAEFGHILPVMKEHQEEYQEIMKLKSYKSLLALASFGEFEIGIGVPAGYSIINFYMQKSSPNLSMIYVHPDARRRGIGKMLCESACQWLKTKENVKNITGQPTPAGKRLLEYTRQLLVI